MARYELSGVRYAIVGILLSLTCGIAGPIWVARDFQSEAPADVERVDFSSLIKADAAKVDVALAPLVGKRICLKGYISPAIAGGTFSTFTLIPDGRASAEGAVQVDLGSSRTTRYSHRPLAVSGTLVINSAHASNSQVPKYELVNPDLRPSRTRYQVAGRANTGC